MTFRVGPKISWAEIYVILKFYLFSFSLIGIQEIGNKESLNYIIEELNNPTIPFIKDWADRSRGKWKYTISDKGSEYLGFLYDESIGNELKKASLLLLKTSCTQSPYMTIFRLYDKIDLVFVNTHLKTQRLDEEKQIKDETLSLSAVTQAINDIIGKIKRMNVIPFFLNLILKNKNILSFLEISILYQQLRNMKH
jgi:hypothetical protein